MKNCLISGVNGFIGSALAKKLLDRKCRVVGIVKDRNYKTRRDILDNISVVYGSITDFDTIRYAMSHYDIDTVFHLAAITILTQGWKDPVTTYQVNTMGTVNVLEAARQMKVKKVVNVSSDKVYGVYERFPYVESMAVQASRDAYSTSKSCMDLISQQYAWGHDLDCSIVRAGNIYGPGDLNLGRLVPKSILLCLNDVQPVLYRGAGQYKREFMYIDDVIDACLVVADRGLPGEAYNIGGSGYQSIYNTVKEIIQLTGRDFEPKTIDKDFVEVKEHYLDSSKIEKLGWKCTVPIHEGLKYSVRWYREWRDKTEFFDGYKYV